ncbi:hypothetical protein RCL1_006901 [Eukaryota sp. TZLM3-RCL]
MALSFLGSKSWHVGRNANIEAVNKAEREAKLSEHRAQQRRQELDSETHYLEMKLLEASEEEKEQVKAQASLRFLYAPPPGLAVDTTTDKPKEEAPAVPEPVVQKTKFQPPPAPLDETKIQLKTPLTKSPPPTDPAATQEAIKELLKDLTPEEKVTLLKKFEALKKQEQDHDRDRTRRSSRADLPGQRSKYKRNFD